MEKLLENSHKSHITYQELLEIVSWGIFSMNIRKGSVNDKRLKDCRPIDGAMHNGIYVGSPGKDIYLMLPYLSNDQMIEVARKVSDNFPFAPPVTHVQYTACIRFIYGQFDKQGILRSDEDFKKMKKKKIDWSLPRKFLSFLCNEFERNNNFYGLSIVYEIEGHRLGDEAVINEDNGKLDRMEEAYNKSVKFAKKCGSPKQMFSIHYWAGEYFKKFKDKKRAIKYFKKSIENAPKYYYRYFPHGEQYYRKRLSQSLSYIRKNDKNNWDKFYNSNKKKIFKVIKKYDKGN